MAIRWHRGKPVAVTWFVIHRAVTSSVTIPRNQSTDTRGNIARLNATDIGNARVEAPLVVHGSTASGAPR